jgi:SanA protein
VFKKILKMTIQVIIWLLVGAAVAVGASKLYAELYARSRLYTPASAPTKRVAIVFGAGLRRDGSPSPILQDRVKAAADLYFSGKVEKILMSGDNSFLDYNEPGAMLNFALDLGVPQEDIVLDYAGRRTYDTCYRAKSIFGVSDALLVTQRYHLPRAIFTCNALGLKSVGVIADQRDYHSPTKEYWEVREIGATIVAIWEVWITRPLPVLGDPEPIFTTQENNLDAQSYIGTHIAHK